MRLFRNYGLSIVLGALFVSSWLLQALTGWVKFSAEQASHGSSAQLLGGQGYVWTWLAQTFENWQSEFLQLFAMVVLTAFLIHRGSHESRDSDEELMAAVTSIEARLMRMERQAGR